MVTFYSIFVSSRPMYIYNHTVSPHLEYRTQKTSHFDIFINVYFFYIPVQVCMSVFILLHFPFFDLPGASACEGVPHARWASGHNETSVVRWKSKERSHQLVGGFILDKKLARHESGKTETGVVVRLGVEQHEFFLELRLAELLNAQRGSWTLRTESSPFCTPTLGNKVQAKAAGYNPARLFYFEERLIQIYI